MDKVKGKNIKSENVMDLLESIKEPDTCEEYMKLKDTDKFLLQLSWNKRELDTDGAFDSSTKIKELSKPLEKYTLVVVDRDTNELIGEYNDIYEFAKNIDVDIDEARYLIEHSHRIYNKSKYKSYHLIKVECNRYELKDNDYILTHAGLRANRYF